MRVPSAVLLGVFLVSISTSTLAEECARTFSTAIEDLSQGVSPGVEVPLAERLGDCAADFEALLDLGQALEEAGNAASAEEAYRLAIVSDPESAIPFMRLASLAREEDRPDDYDLYRGSAEALADTEEEKASIAELDASAEDVEAVSLAGREYEFKEEGDLVRKLGIGSKSIRPKSVPQRAVGSDYFASSKGLGANLGIEFEVGTTKLLPGSQAQVEELGRALLRATAGEEFVVEGHASTEGPLAFNDELSQRRAEAIMASLVEGFGFPVSRLEAVGRGIQYPVIIDGVEDRVRSRRVTVLRLYDE